MPAIKIVKFIQYKGIKNVKLCTQIGSKNAKVNLTYFFINSVSVSKAKRNIYYNMKNRFLKCETKLQKNVKNVSHF